MNERVLVGWPFIATASYRHRIDRGMATCDGWKKAMKERDWRMAAAGESRPRSVPSGAIAKPKRNDLSLKLKYEVIKAVEKEPKIGIRKLAGLFSCGKNRFQQY